MIRLVKVKTLHIFDNDYQVLRTIKVFTLFGITLFTKTIGQN